MTEVGLLPFARITLQEAKAVLPRYRGLFSKHQFTQPQLLAILCLMRYEDWTFRPNDRPSRWRDRASVARHAPKRPTTSPRRRGRHGFGARMVGRYGGEEFLVVLNRCDPASTLARAENLRAAVSGRSVPIAGKALSVTISIGLALS